MSPLRRLRDIYDIVVVGAGPAGLSATLRLLSESGGSPTVLLVDKCESWRGPIACAEGVLKPLFHKALSPRPSWIRLEVDRATLHAPGGAQVSYRDKNKGYIIDRRLMQRELAADCDDAGADCRHDMRVEAVGPPSLDGIRVVRFDGGAEVKSRVVVDCSGPLSRIGGDQGIDWKCRDLEPAYFAHVKNVRLDTGEVHIYVGKKVAPGGYAWVFPRGDDEANVGVLLGSRFRRGADIRALLERVIEEEVPGGKVIVRLGGCIPCAAGKRVMAVPGLLKAGDAAGTVNPFSRAGISEAMICGRLAAESALKMLGANSRRDLVRICRRYEKSWNTERGNYHRRLSKVKNSLASVPDSDYNAAAAALSAIPQGRLKMSRIFSVSLRRFPRLVWALRYRL